MTSETRNQAKRLAYGVLYGMGPHTLAPLLGVTSDAAEAKRRSFLDSMPALRDWLEGVRKGLTADNISITVGRRFFVRMCEAPAHMGARRVRSPA